MFESNEKIQTATIKECDTRIPSCVVSTVNILLIIIIFPIGSVWGGGGGGGGGRGVIHATVSKQRRLFESYSEVQE